MTQKNASLAFDTRRGLWQSHPNPYQFEAKPMATKQARGTKRTCQSNECGARFYDLDRSPVVCPMCGSIYELASAPAAIAAAAGDDKAQRGKPKKEFAIDKAHAVEDAPAAEGEEALADIETGEEEIAAEEDETFLEEEEESEGGDVSNIIGGPVQEGGEEP
jgi:uncharacterized protein (TIGR02300 family)